MTGIFGNATAERVLLYLQQYEEGYALGIAQTFELPVSQIQRQLIRMESTGVLVSRLKGRTRVFQWNPQCYFLKDLRAMLSRILEFLPREEQQKHFLKRTRPRRTGKPV